MPIGSDITYDADGNLVINGVVIPGTGPFDLNVNNNLNNPPAGVTAEQWATIQQLGYIDPALFPNLSGQELLTLSQSLGVKTMGSDLAIDASDLEALNYDFGAPTTYIDPNTGLPISEADYTTLYGDLGNTGEITNPNVTVNADGSRINTDPVTGITTFFAADGTVTGVTDAEGNFTDYTIANVSTTPEDVTPAGITITNESDVLTNLPELWDPYWVQTNIEGLGDNPIGGLTPKDVRPNADGGYTVVLVDGSTLQVDSSGNISDAVNNFSANVISQLDQTPPGYGTVSMDMLQNFFDTIGASDYGKHLATGSMTADDIRNIGLGAENLANFEALYSKYDPSGYGGFAGDRYPYNARNPYYGQGTGMATVWAYDPATQNVQMMSESEADALGWTKYYNPNDLAAVHPDVAGGAGGTVDDTTGLTTTAGPFDNTNFDFNIAFNNWMNERFSQQQNNQGFGGLLGLLGGYGRGYGGGYGGGYGPGYGNIYGGSGYSNPSYGNPFSGGYGYGYGANPYAGGIGSFYGNMGSGWSPYSTGSASGYGSNPFFGGYGGSNYNQMQYNPYSSLWNQYSNINPSTGGYTGDVYSQDYQDWFSSPYEGDKYTTGYQDYLSSNYPDYYSSLYGTA